MGKSKKKTQAFLPKRIAGVKVPKGLRKGRAGQFLASPLGVALVSEAAVAAGTWAASHQGKPGSAARRFADHPLTSLAHLAEDARVRGAASTEALREAFAAASAAFSDTLRHSADAQEAAAKKASAREAARAS